MEFLNPKYQFRRDCAVHGPGGRINLQLLQPIRAAPMMTDRRVDTRRVLRPGDYELDLQPVFLQAQTVIGNDPYNSVKLAALRPRILAPPPKEEEPEGPPEPEAPPVDPPSAAVSEPDPSEPRFEAEPIRPTILQPDAPPNPPASDDDDTAPIFRRFVPIPAPPAPAPDTPPPPATRPAQPTPPPATRPARRTEDGPAFDSGTRTPQSGSEFPAPIRFNLIDPFGNPRHRGRP